MEKLKQKEAKALGSYVPNSNPEFHKVESNVIVDEYTNLEMSPIKIAEKHKIEYEDVLNILKWRDIYIKEKHYPRQYRSAPLPSIIYSYFKDKVPSAKIAKRLNLPAEVIMYLRRKYDKRRAKIQHKKAKEARARAKNDSQHQKGSQSVAFGSMDNFAYKRK
jgi:hypothetical protein